MVCFYICVTIQRVVKSKDKTLFIDYTIYFCSSDVSVTITSMRKETEKKALSLYLFMS